ncbi:unnamed protein product [Vitrella brassicaformis CCMP3155]|uniref:Uncharacterized protein n=2 Tax=Vitrella brassicaformis TaxID=1169539 RepID=A0A0G4G833_VITBC|nr:unnamed protein product [Vitrella brassicaformis CCMP3155]|eukprot:CEM24790.1 unnamed protein product [Vitrella brassicaformis CCMP3155]
MGGNWSNHQIYPETIWLRWSTQTTVWGVEYPQGTVLEFKKDLLDNQLRYAGYLSAEDIQFGGCDPVSDSRPALEAFDSRGEREADPLVILVPFGPMPKSYSTTKCLSTMRLPWRGQHNQPQ